MQGAVAESSRAEGKLATYRTLFAQAMQKDMAQGKTDFLIDGFPRNLDNVARPKLCV